jgi:hypothetical protein
MFNTLTMDTNVAAVNPTAEAIATISFFGGVGPEHDGLPGKAMQRHHRDDTFVVESQAFPMYLIDTNVVSELFRRSPDPEVV